MASPPTQQEQKKSMAMAMFAPQLLTPDQTVADTFVVSGPEPRMPSPPASPEFNAEATFQHKDDVLYPDHNITDSAQQQAPLFPDQSWTTSEQEHPSPTATSVSVATPRSSVSSPDQHNAQQPRKPSKARDGVDRFQTYGYEYWKYCVSQNEEYRARQKASRELPRPTQRSNGLQRDSYSNAMVSSLGGVRIGKQHTTAAATKAKATPRDVPVKPAARSQAPVATSKVESPAKRSRRKTATPDPSLGALPHGAQPKPRTRAAPTKKIDDKSNAEWNQLPDFCPPTSSLDTMSKRMTASWTNGNPLNLDNDPDREHLHPQELAVASVLRLQCNSYLANKRRIFAARHQAYIDNKDFNKTSAQVSAKIDVNKSSKLWEAFDSVGWFDKHWFEL